jgi:hypothetical protein
MLNEQQLGEALDLYLQLTNAPAYEGAEEHDIIEALLSTMGIPTTFQAVTQISFAVKTGGTL